jgi:hypothetical protein
MSGRIDTTDIGFMQRHAVSRSLRDSHYIQRLTLVLCLCFVSGCWEEIEYRDPGPIAGAPSNDAAPQPPATLEGESTQVADTTETTDTTSTEVALPPEAATAGNRYTGVPESEPAPANEAPSDATAVEGTPPETSSAEEGPNDTPAVPAVATSVTPPASSIEARHAAWMLGSRLSLAALANDRGIAPEDVPNWFEEAQLLATDLKVPIALLPEKPAANSGEAASKAVIAYLLDQEKAMGAEMEKSGDMEMSALFRLAMRTNLLLVLNEPGSKPVNTIVKSIEALGPRTGLPAELWQPLLDMLNQQASPAAVRTAVRQMHTDVGRHLARAEL